MTVLEDEKNVFGWFFCFQNQKFLYCFDRENVSDL